MLNPTRPLIRASGRSSDKGTGAAAGVALDAGSKGWSLFAVAGISFVMAAATSAGLIGGLYAGGAITGPRGTAGPSPNTTLSETLDARLSTYTPDMFMGRDGNNGTDGAPGATGTFDPFSTLYNATLVTPAITGGGTWDTPVFQDMRANTVKASGLIQTDHLGAIGSVLSIAGGMTQEIQFGLGPNMSLIQVGTFGPVTINVGNALSTLHLYGTVVDVVSEVAHTNQTLIVLNQGGLVGSAGGVGVYLDEGNVQTPLVRVAASRDAVELKAPTSVTMRLDQSVDTTSSPVFVGLSTTTLNGRNLATMINTLDSIEATRDQFVSVANASLISLRADVNTLHALTATLNTTMIGNVATVTALATSFNASIWAQFTGTSSVLTALAATTDARVLSLNTSILALQTTVSTLLVAPTITGGGSWTGTPTISTLKGPGTATLSMPTVSVSDTFVLVGATQTLSAKTLASPVLTGTVTGSATYNTPVLVSPTVDHVLSQRTPGATVTAIHANAGGLVLGTGSNDMTGTITWTQTGAMATSVTQGACTVIATVVFAASYPNAPGVSLAPNDAVVTGQIGTGNRMPFPQSTTTGFSVCAGTATFQNVFIALRYFVIG